MQQHSYPSHSKHFVLPLSPFTMVEMVELAAEPGPLRLTRPEEDEVHILVWGLTLGVCIVVLGDGKAYWLRSC